MDQKTYLAERIDDQINWYSKKSKTFQTRYKTLKVVVIIGSVTIPFLVGLIEDGTANLKIAVGIIGIVIAAIEGILSLYKYQDLWLQYRLASEMLKREKIIFLTGSGPYKDNTEAFQHFVKRAESIMASENQSWLSGQQQEEETEE
jgi:hypothetical protein